MDFDDLDDVVGGRTYDITIFGATGYQGALMCEHLDALMVKEETPRKWAIAGRNKKKLEKLSRNCRTKPEVMEAADKEGIELMCELSSVVINVAGPYILCGTPVVEACVEKKTHYIDITWELVWMKRMLNIYHEKAKEAGVQIVQCCGTMCAPEDFGSYMLAQKLGPLKSLDLYQMEVGAGGGGGTFLSGFAGYEVMYGEELDALINPFSLGGQRKCGTRKGDKDPEEAVEAASYPGVWLSGGHSTPCAQRIIRRTCELFEGDADSAPKYGEEILVTSRYCFGTPGAAKQRTATTKEPKDIFNLIKHANTMQEALKRGQIAPPGTGPNFKARTEGLADFFIVAESESGETAHVRFRGPDVFEITAMATVTGALVMVEESEAIKPKDRGGVLSPAYAFHGSNYIERLIASPYAGHAGHEISFELRDGMPDETEIMAAIKASDAKAADIFARNMRGGIEGGCAPPELLH